MADHDTAPAPIRSRSEWRTRLECAAAGGSSQAEVRALELLGRSHGWDTPEKRKAKPRPLPVDPIERIQQQLQDVRVNRATAERDGSHVAARGYLSDEIALSAQLDAAMERRATEQRASRDGAAIIAAFREDLVKLPMALRREIRRIVLDEVPGEGQ